MGSKDLKLEKITLNIGAGGNPDNLEKAENLLQMISEQKPVRTPAKSTVAEFGVKEGDPVGIKVTLRGKKAKEVLNDSFEAVESRIKRKQISENGNFSFGVDEYIEMPGMKYDPDIGMFGFDVCVNLKRTGFRINKRRNRPKKIPEKVKISKEEVENFLKNEYEVEVE